MNIDDNLLVRSLAMLGMDATQVAEAETREEALRSALSQMKEGPHGTAMPSPLEEGNHERPLRQQETGPAPKVKKKKPKPRGSALPAAYTGTKHPAPRRATQRRWPITSGRIVNVFMAVTLIVVGFTTRLGVPGVPLTWIVLGGFTLATLIMIGALCWAITDSGRSERLVMLIRAMRADTSQPTRKRYKSAPLASPRKRARPATGQSPRRLGESHDPWEHDESE